MVVACAPISSNPHDISCPDQMAGILLYRLDFFNRPTTIIPSRRLFPSQVTIGGWSLEKDHNVGASGIVIIIVVTAAPPSPLT